jgi:hypothetical protein
MGRSSFLITRTYEERDYLLSLFFWGESEFLDYDFGLFLLCLIKQELEGAAPHPYALAHKAFCDMRDNRVNQSIIISGESGIFIFINCYCYYFIFVYLSNVIWVVFSFSSSFFYNSIVSL